FFQAEDGIRDRNVTGVQTCALPIYLSAIHSVASFFVSRVDTEVDSRLPEDSPLRGRAGLANARLAYEAYEQVFAGERFARLAEQIGRASGRGRGESTEGAEASETRR